MNIKQASKQSGVSAPNIRFYEKEGLLNPARLPGNDYRDYTEQDIRTLRFIRMLRMLDVPLPVIRSVLAGDASLGSVLREQKTALEQRAKQLEGAARFCAELARQDPSVASLDVDACLTRMESPAAELFLRLGAGLPHAGAGAASEAFFLYSGGQHQHPAGVHSGPADLRKGQRDAAQPDKRRNVPGIFAGWDPIQSLPQPGQVPR